MDTESDASSDFLDTMTAGGDGELILLRPINDARTIVVRHNQNAGSDNNILMADADPTLDLN